ncbi:alpha/beta fold hydrolase [Pararhodonellum marinum]|uniref:alpha/beta fold hydrolase n=1 Tax=Pararhodonellum marinum TaxID=2755358 RepID=UPI0018905D6C|nr:alpha/beta hydrolase [Pararhodonellum marinum]
MKNLIYRSLGIYLNTLTRIAPKKGGEVGFRLFCKPQKTKMKAHHKAFLKTARQEVLDFNGTPIKIYLWGKGSKKVLFVHGWQSHSYRWKKYVNSLSESDFTLIAFDAPGHGKSGGDQFTVPLNAFLISQLAKKYGGFDTVVAHSIGSISVLYALNYYNITNIGKVISMASPSRAEEFFAFYIQALRLKEPTVAQIKNEFQRQIRHELEDISLSTYARKINVEGLIIHDKRDPETPFENALELLDSWGNATLFETQGLGHNLRSIVVVNLVKDFILGKPLDETRYPNLTKKELMLQ